ncbi:MAG: tetratricopeptide repeat protein [Ignavibacteriaceae bacterium]|nr:tetratricopeptide repeat protein [Ignavibacteriaceae bacterium]
MKNSKLFLLGMLILGIMFLGFQCASTELTSAKLYIQQKNWDKAIETLNTEVTKNPQSDEGYFLLGTVYSEQDNIDKMIESFDKSLAISNKFEKNIEEYKAFQWANNFNRGVSLFQRGNKVTDKDSSKMYFDMAIEAYKNAIELEPDSAETYRNLAFVYLTTQQAEESIEPLNKLIEIEQAEEGYQYLGEVYYTLGINMMSDFNFSKNAQDSIKAMDYYDKAIVTLEEGLQKYPENSEMQVARTSAYIGAGRIDEAIASSKLLVEKKPDDKIYRYNYGVLLLNSEKYAEAETQLKEALKIDPEYENAIYNLGVTYVKWGTAINKEAEQQGVISEDYKKKYEAALPYMEKVVEKDQTNVAIWELLGKVYSVLGMQEDAANAFKKADELR